VRRIIFLTLTFYEKINEQIYITSGKKRVGAFPQIKNGKGNLLGETGCKTT
jgi:hypothetical protein